MYANWDPVFHNLPFWLRLVCSLDTFWNSWYYATVFFTLFLGKLDLNDGPPRMRLPPFWLELIVLFGSGALIYSCVVYFAWEFLAAPADTNMVLMTIINAPWIIAPHLLVYRLYVVHTRTQRHLEDLANGKAK